MNALRLTFALLLLPVCGWTEEVDPIGPATTIHEIMHHHVMPAAEVVWGATAIYITIEGEDDRSPKNDAEWAVVEQSRIALEEAINALLIPREVDEPGAEVDYAEQDLKPDQIHALIVNEPQVWAAMISAVDATVQQAKQAIADQDVEALRDIGGAIDGACEACHKHFWYPK